MLVTVVIMFLLCWGPKLILKVLKSLHLEALYYPEVFQAQVNSVVLVLKVKQYPSEKCFYNSLQQAFVVIFNFRM